MYIHIYMVSSGSINTTVRMHHMATDKTHREKSKQEMLNNTTSYIEQLETTPHETAAVCPLITHLLAM